MAPSLDLMAHLACETLRISVPTIVDAAFGTISPEVCNERLNSWSRRLMEGAEIRLKVSGHEHVIPGEGYVVMSNHQSHYDIPVLFQALCIPMRMVAKKELFRIPFMAGAMRAAGFVELDRQNPRSAFGTVVTTHRRLYPAMSIWIAPEGTRSRTGQLAPFKRGGFRMAIESGMRILPVTIDGTRQTLPAGRFDVRRGQLARVTISPPVAPDTYGLEGITQLVAAVREAIEQHLPTNPVTQEVSLREGKHERNSGACGVGFSSQG
jgi:1-acyl-sn-glycerol-3-phosphate acyltransferase